LSEEEDEADAEALADALSDALAEASPEGELSASGRISLAHAVNAASTPALVAPNATRRLTPAETGEGLIIISLSKEVSKGN
jgi:hypothetical protein